MYHNKSRLDTILSKICKPCIAAAVSSHTMEAVLVLPSSSFSLYTHVFKINDAWLITKIPFYKIMSQNVHGSSSPVKLLLHLPAPW